MCHLISKTMLVAFVISLLLSVSMVAAQPASSRRVEVTLNEGTSMAIALSPDGTTLAMDLLGALWTVSVVGGPARRITDELSDVRQPAWFPDGRTITFQSYRLGSWDIWAVGADGTDLRQETWGPFDDREPHVSPDGRRLAFSSDRSGNYDIWVLTLETGELQQLTHSSDNEFMPAWSPDGTEVAFASDRSESPGVWAVTFDGHERLVAESDGSVYAPSWSPDGRQILFNVITNNQSRLMLSGRPLTSEEDVFPFRAQWISDREFFYTADGKIKRRSVRGGNVQTVEFTAALSFTREAYPRKRRDFDSTDPRPVLGIMGPVLSPDATQVAFAALGDLWVMPVGGQPRPLTQDRFVEMDPAWSPDGSHLAFSSDRAGTMDLWLRNMRTGQERALTSLVAAETAAAWSPDGTRIAFLNDAGEVHTVNVQTGETQKVHDALFRPGHPTWSADGRVIALSALRRYSTRFREGVNQILAISLEDQPDRLFAPVPHRSAGTRGTDGPVWSPDGTQMALVMSGVLWTVPVDPKGEPIGPPRQLSRERAESPSWSQDSSQILFQSNDRLKMVSVTDGRVREVPLNLTWKPSIPEGRTVIHAGRLFDGREPELRHDVDIVVVGNRIQSIEEHRAELHGEGVIDAADQTVMPGLIETHTHFRRWFGENLGRIWLAYGVTTIRTPSALPYEILADREAFDSGVRPGPRVFMTGNTFDGPRIYYSGGMSLEAGTQVEMELERARILEYDWIKTYVRLPDLVQKRVVEYAHAHGIGVTSHELYPAVSYGVDGVEHISGTSRRGYSPKVTALRHSYGDVIDLIAASGMTITPTIGIMGGFMYKTHQDEELLDDPRFVRLFPPWVVEGTRKSMAERIRNADLEIVEAQLRALEQTVLAIVRSGGRVIAGTDSPIVPYGVSLHTELEHYVDAGLSPYEALQSATLVAAEALGAEQDLGTIEAGKLADMVILDGDPLADIKNARKVQRVVKNGEVFDLETLLGGE